MALRKQVKFGNRSAAAIDQGDDDEGVRVALTLRILLHDTDDPNQASLLEMLGLKSVLSFLDSRPWPLMWGIGEDGVRVSEVPAALATAAGQPLRWKAPLEASAHDRPQLPFAKWWFDGVIDLAGYEPISRKQLVSYMAHQDGGAHIDPKGLKGPHRELKATGGGNIFIGDLPPGEFGLPETVDSTSFRPPAGDAAAASVRQVWYELLVTLSTHRGVADMLTVPQPG